MTEPAGSPRDLPDLDPDQFVGGTSTGQNNPVGYSSNDRRDDGPDSDADADADQPDPSTDTEDEDQG